MKDDRKTKAQLIQELKKLRTRNAKLERMEQRQRSLEEMWKRYEFIVNTSREFLSLVDTRYRYVAVNDSYCRAHMKTREDIVGRTVPDLWGPAVFTGIIRPQIDRCFSGDEVHYQAEFEFPALGLKTIDVNYYPYIDDRGRVTHAVIVSRDVSDHMRAKEELLALKKAVETMQLGVTISNVGGKILFTNQAEARMHGYSVEELLNNDVRIFGPKDLWRPRTVESLDTIRRWKRECTNIRKDGSFFPVQLHSDVVKNLNGNPIAVVTTCEDITERKEIEKKMRANLDRLTSLREIDMVILSSLDLGVIMNVILNHLVAHLKAQAAVVMLLNQKTLMLEYAGGRGIEHRKCRNLRVKLGDGLAGKVALERRTLSIPEINDRMHDFVRPAFLGGNHPVSYIGIPLLAKGQVKGTLEIFHAGTVEEVPDWLEFLETLAGQAAIAIDNASLFSDLQNSNTDLMLAYDTTLDGWSRALDLRDKETEGHSRRVTELTVQIAEALGIDQEELKHIRRGALLHDIGKMGVPDRILLKPGPLDDDEWEIMKMHCQYALDLLSPIHFLRPSIDIPYCHHERWDGTGYPRGLKGNEIPAAARVFAIADVWDALRSDRPYRPAYGIGEAMKYIEVEEEDHFDPEVVEVFFSLIKNNARH